MFAALGIAYHDQSNRATKAVGAVGDRPLLVLPGMEVTTHLGHVVALFPPERPDDLVDFGSPGTSRSSLTSGTAAGRSSRSLLDLATNDIESRGRLAILVHADSDEGIAASVTGTELASLFTHQGIAALESRERQALEEWVTEDDAINSRRSGRQSLSSATTIARGGATLTGRAREDGLW